MTPAEIARVIIDEVPRSRGDLVSASVLALLVLLDEGEEWLVSDIREALGVPWATASKIVDDAVRGGFVGRRQHVWDRRKTIVELTPKGKQVRRRRRGNR
jgi:DNA-binding MarR family transcriptional regulator